MLNAYRDDYPKTAIGGGNPYYQCASCRRSAPEINGKVSRHEAWCGWRKEQEAASRTLTPEEASAAADCVAAMLEDFANLDPACVLMVWAGPVHAFHKQMSVDKYEAHFSRPVDEPATQARVAAARAALVKLREVAR
jgi:hypothetical protein